MKLVKNVALLLIAILLGTLLLPIGFLYALIRSAFKGRGENYLYKVALSIDQLGNTICADFFNLLLIKGTQNLFGNEDETISSVLGKNQKTQTLTFLGKGICFILNSLDKNHVEKAIGS